MLLAAKSVVHIILLIFSLQANHLIFSPAKLELSYHHYTTVLRKMKGSSEFNKCSLFWSQEVQGLQTPACLSTRVHADFTEHTFAQGV
jgi:hypothetical protein